MLVLQSIIKLLHDYFSLIVISLVALRWILKFNFPNIHLSSKLYFTVFVAFTLLYYYNDYVIMVNVAKQANVLQLIDYGIRCIAAAAVLLFGGMLLLFWILGASTNKLNWKVIKYWVGGIAVLLLVICIPQLALHPDKFANYLPFTKQVSTIIIRIPIYTIALVGSSIYTRQLWQISIKPRLKRTTEHK